MIVTDKINPNLFYNYLSTKITLVRSRYSDEEVDHRLVFRLRPISMAKKIYESAVNNQIVFDPEIKKLIPKN
jgi:hypothetical protein